MPIPSLSIFSPLVATAIARFCFVKIKYNRKTTSMCYTCYTLTILVRRKEWVSCLVLIGFTYHLIRSSALPARSLPVVSGKPHAAATYSEAQLSLDTPDRSYFNNSTVHCVMSTPNATATNIGGRLRPTTSSFPSLVLTPINFN